MEMKVYKCTSCQSSMKYGKDKAGRKSKCPKCGAEMTLPADEDAKPTGDDDGEGGAYNVAFVDDEAEKKAREEAQAKKAQKKVFNKIKVRRKSIGDLEAWQRVNNGLFFLMIGTCVWGAAFGLQALVVFLGMVQGPELGVNADKFLVPQWQPPLEPGVPLLLDKPKFFLSLVSGSDFVGTAQVLLIVAQVLTFIQIALWMVGYGMCLSIENRFGARGQLFTLFSLGGTNALLNLFFRFLPLVGAIGYVLVPFYAPEIAMGEINTERSAPIIAGWCSLPSLEIFITVLIHLILQLEPILIGMFIWTIATMVRDEPTESRAQGLVKLGCSVLFLLLAYHLYACAGNSSVLVKLLRIIYTLWFAFQLGFIVKLATTCAAARDLLRFYLKPDE